MKKNTLQAHKMVCVSSRSKFAFIENYISKENHEECPNFVVILIARMRKINK